jgi:hypothetical protein
MIICFKFKFNIRFHLFKVVFVAIWKISISYLLVCNFIILFNEVKLIFILIIILKLINWDLFELTKQIKIF